MDKQPQSLYMLKLLKESARLPSLHFCVLIHVILYTTSVLMFFRWLMRSAARSGKIGLAMVTCDGRQVPFHVRKKDVKTSQSVQQHLQHLAKQPIHVDKRIHEVVKQEMVPKSNFERSVGSRQSDQEAFVNTIEMAAQIGRSSFKYSNKRLQGKVS